MASPLGDSHLTSFTVEPVPGLSLELRAPPPSSDEDAKELVSYALTGPPEALECLRAAAGVREGDSLPESLQMGALSPISFITLEPGNASSKRIGVPPCAKSFAFSYPFGIDRNIYGRILEVLR